MPKTIIALPSKGRIKQQSDAYIARCGLKIISDGDGRGYHDTVEGRPDIEVKRLPSSIIAESLLNGSVHFGLTGLDLVAERNPEYERVLSRLAKLDFGLADLIVAVPNFWLDVEYMSDLRRLAQDLRTQSGRRLTIATKYHGLTRAFLERHGLVDYQLIDSQGATEAAPANFVADIIVDITTSGATLEANHLKILRDGLILKTQANLWRSNTADWHDGATQLTKILGRHQA